MASFPNQQLTDVGWNALAEALAGQRLKFMRMSVGDGQLPSNQTLAEQTDLIHHVMDIPIIDYRPAGPGKIIVTGALRSSDVVTGFFLREIGLWCTLTPEDGEEGEPILYSINNAADEADYVPAKDEASVVIQSIEIQVIISKAPHVEVVVVLAEVYLQGENIGQDQDEPEMPHPAGLFKERVANRMRFRRLNPVPGLLALKIEEEPDIINLSITAGVGGGGGGETGGQGAGVVMTGTLLPFAGEVAPMGYLIADGRLISVESYPGLFAVLGTRYGGDGVTTFGLPDCKGRTLVGVGSLDIEPGWGLALGEKQGARAMTLTQAHMPAHAHLVDINHMHGAIATGGHNHGDPGHFHYSAFWHDHASPAHTHTFHWVGRDSNVVLAFHQMREGSGGTREYIGHYLSDTAVGQVLLNATGVGISANWAAGNSDVRGCGLHDAGNLGGYTSWVDNPSRATDSRGSGAAFSMLQPSLGVNYIIKT